MSKREGTPEDRRKEMYSGPNQKALTPQFGPPRRISEVHAPVPARRKRSRSVVALTRASRPAPAP
jgi:hypothetical protein